MPSFVLCAVLLAAACSDEPGPADSQGTGGAPGTGGAAMSQSDRDAAPSPAPATHAIDAGSGSGGAPGSPPHTPPTTEPHDAGNSEVEDAATHLPTDAGELDAGRPPPNSPTTVYSTSRYDGDLTHVTVFKHEPDPGYCVTFSVAFPTASHESELDLPEGWGAEVAYAFPTEDETCDDTSATGRELVMADIPKLRGRVEWVDLDQSRGPCSMNIDVTAMFMPTLRIPARVDLFAENLAIPCGP